MNRGGLVKVAFSAGWTISYGWKIRAARLDRK